MVQPIRLSSLLIQTSMIILWLIQASIETKLSYIIYQFCPFLNKILFKIFFVCKITWGNTINYKKKYINDEKNYLNFKTFFMSIVCMYIYPFLEVHLYVWGRIYYKFWLWVMHFAYLHFPLYYAQFLSKEK